MWKWMFYTLYNIRINLRGFTLVPGTTSFAVFLPHYCCIVGLHNCLTMSLILIGLRKSAFAICFAKSIGLQYGQKSYYEKGEFLILCPGWGGFEIKIWTNMRAMGKQNKRDFSKDRDLTTFARETAIVWVKFDFSTSRENWRDGQASNPYLYHAGTPDNTDMCLDASSIFVARIE